MTTCKKPNIYREEMNKAPSACIWIFLNPQLFLSRFINLPIHMKRIQIKFAGPYMSDGIRIHSRETRPTCRASILVYCAARDWTQFTLSDLKISGFPIHMLSDT